MTQMSLTDKIGILYEMIKSSKIYILVFIVLLFIGYVLTSTSKKKSQTIKIIFLIIYLIILGTIVYLNHVNLSNMFDYMMNNLFIVIYFPNLAVYLAAIIITNIIMWTSILNNKVSKLMRNINVTVYSIITYLLIKYVSLKYPVYFLNYYLWNIFLKIHFLRGMQSLLNKAYGMILAKMPYH